MSMFRFTSLLLLLVILMVVPAPRAVAGDLDDALAAILAGYLIHEALEDARDTPSYHYCPPPPPRYGPPPCWCGRTYAHHHGFVSPLPQSWGHTPPRWGHGHQSPPQGHWGPPGPQHGYRGDNRDRRKIVGDPYRR